MTDFLLELRAEEIPARMQAKAKDDLARLLRDHLSFAGLKWLSTESLATPRRLAVIARGLPDEVEGYFEELKGPRTTAPPQALEGFLRKNGLTREDVTEEDGVFYATISKPGRATADVLAEVIPAIVRAFPWPKSMRWGDASISTESLRWVRPLQGIVALFGDAIVPCDVDGIVSGAATAGHRFHHHGPVMITSADDYVETLRAAHVIVHLSERCQRIEDGAAKAAAAAGLTVIPDAGLVLENAGLTEWPVPLLGRFDAAFLDVPREVIQLTMRTNQKYFACTGAAGALTNAFVCTANIAASDGGAAVIAGNEKVLSARLADAKFFWNADLKVPLADQAAKLSGIVFHEKLGTVADKVDRVAKLARWLCDEGIVKPSALQGKGWGEGKSANTPGPVGGDIPHPNPSPEGEGLSLADMAETAARLCKADLVTGMVGEFPELQGVMGGYYARAQGYPDAVADAIRDHYKPVGQGDDVPTAPVTVAVSLADKLDSLCAFFVAGEIPSGSRDPFALRRSALGVIAILIANDLRLPFFEFIHVGIPQVGKAMAAVYSTREIRARQEVAAVSLRPPSELRSLLNPFAGQSQIEWDSNEILREIATNAEAAPQKLVDFLADRLKVQQREAGVRHDLIDAVFALGGEDDLVRLLARVKALQGFVTTNEGKNLLAGYKRAANILKKEQPKPLPLRGGVGVGDVPVETTDSDCVDNPHPNPSSEGEGLNDALPYQPETAEQSLIDALDAAEPRVVAAIGREDFEGAMSALASLRAPIDAFFEAVTVNDPDAAKRAARLALLARVRDAVHRVADFSKIEG